MKVTHILFSLLTLSVSSAWAVSYDADQKIETPLVLDGEYVVEVASGVTVEFSREISGTGPLRKTGAGTLVLSNGNNTFTEGVQISQGYVRADKEGCLGDGRIFIDGTVATSGATGVTRQINFNADGATFANEILVEGKDPGAYSPTATFIRTDVKTVLLGAITFQVTSSSSSTTGISAGTNKKSGTLDTAAELTIRNSFTYEGGYVRVGAYGKIRMEGPVDLGTMYVGYNSVMAGQVTLVSSQNKISLIIVNGANVIAENECAFGGAALQATGQGANRSTYDLGGKNQTVQSLKCSSTTVPSVTTAKAATLTIVGKSAAESSNQLLSGPLSLVLDAADYPNFNQTLSGASTMTGVLAVSNGTLTVSGTFKKVPEVHVGPAGKMVVSGSTAFAGARKLVVDGVCTITGSAPFASDNSLEIWLGNGEDTALTVSSDLRVKNVYLWDGEKYNRVPNGDHADGTIPHLSGASVNVDNGEDEVVETTWTAGGDENRSIAEVSNWDVSADRLDFSNGKLLATFASSGEIADVDQAVKFLGLRFTRSFTLAKANDVASVLLLGEGLSVAGGITNEIAAPLSVPISQSWAVGEESSLLLSGGLACAAGVRLTSDGLGEVVFGGSGTIDSGVDVSNRHVRVTGRLETPNHVDQGLPRPWQPGGFVVNPNAFRILCTKTDGTVTFDNATVEKPLWVAGNGSVSDDHGWFNMPAGSTNVFLGSIYLESPIGYLSLAADAMMLCKRNLSCGGETHLSKGTLRMEDGVLSATGGNGLGLHLNGRLELASVANTVKFRAYGGTVDIQADSALTNSYLYHLSRTTRFVMNGHSIHFYGIDHDSGTPVFESNAPATLHVGYSDDLKNSRYSGVLSGPVSILKSGAAGTLTLGAAFASTGDLTVEGGTNVLTAAASWSNGTNVFVRKTGALKLQGNRQFNGKFAVLHIDDSGVVELAEGSKQKFHEMYVDGVKVEPGVYGSAEVEGVDHTYAAHFTGKGIVKVGDSGLVLFVR